MDVRRKQLICLFICLVTFSLVAILIKMILERDGPQDKGKYNMHANNK